jgi:hypothetical protein
VDIDAIDFDALSYKQAVALAEKVNAMVVFKRNEAINLLIAETRQRFAEFDLDPVDVFAGKGYQNIPSFLTLEPE